MKGQKVGYQRASTLEQSMERQLKDLVVDKMFTDYASGSTMNRPELQAMLLYIREGDELVVHSIDRLARNLSDLKRLVDDLVGKGCSVHFLKEGLRFNTGQDNHMDSLLLNILGSFAQFERELLLERQREGIEIAKANGKFKGRAPTLTREQAAEAMRRVKDGVPVAQVAREYEISRSGLYRYLRGEVTEYREETKAREVGPENIKKKAVHEETVQYYLDAKGRRVPLKRHRYSELNKEDVDGV